jgi:hypothetical protein
MSEDDSQLLRVMADYGMCVLLLDLCLITFI